MNSPLQRSAWRQTKRSADMMRDEPKSPGQMKSGETAKSLTRRRLRKTRRRGRRRGAGGLGAGPHGCTRGLRRNTRSPRPPLIKETLYRIEFFILLI